MTLKLVDFGYIFGSSLHPVKNTHDFFIFFAYSFQQQSNKENVTFTWPTGVQNVLLLTITGDKFVIYVPIRRYGDCNTLQ
jgi:tetrahydromethanopterin S-methyltransferase subunit H